MTGTSPTETDEDQEYRCIPIELIRDPQQPARETMDEEKFEELCQSIAEVGLIEPIVVKDNNDHFEVIAGHRRTMACRRVGVAKPPCIIRRNRTVSDMAIKIHENAIREDMNPVQEGRFYLEALEQECGGDIDKLCSMLKRGRDYVEGRILLLDGSPRVLAALEGNHISIAVSKLLNKCKDPIRTVLLLDQAMSGGANARQVAEWVRDANGQEPLYLPPEDPEAAARLAEQIAANSRRVCIFCQSDRHANAMETLWAHNVCADNFRDAQTLVNQNNLV